MSQFDEPAQLTHLINPTGFACDGVMSPPELGTIPDAVELAAGEGAARHPSREQSRNTVAKTTIQPILTLLIPIISC